MKVAIALGSNLGEREQTLCLAIKLIGEKLGTDYIVSGFLETLPVLHPDNPERNQPNYLNAVLVVETSASVFEVFSSLKEIEIALGRNREEETFPWSSRVIDLDLIAYGDLVLNEPDLEIPHPRMHEREFVLKPLCEVWPDWLHPRLRKSASELLSTFSK